MSYDDHHLSARNCANLGQFTLQTVQVFFVGLTIGMERTVLPALSGEFGVAKGAYLFLVAFVLSVRIGEGALNFVAGSLSDRIGRKPVMLLGWLFGLPIPLLIFFAPNWWWIIAANIFLGVNQAFAWTMTVTSMWISPAATSAGWRSVLTRRPDMLAVGLGRARHQLSCSALRSALGTAGVRLGGDRCRTGPPGRDARHLRWVHAEHAQTNPAGQRGPTQCRTGATSFCWCRSATRPFGRCARAG